MGDPTTVTIDQVRDALAVLGIVDDFTNISRVTIDPHRIEVVRYRIDEQGRKVSVGPGVAAHAVVEIGITRAAAVEARS